MFESKKSVTVFATGQTVIRERKSFLMRVVWLSVFLFLFAGLIPGVVNANPPKSLTLAYDANAKVLKVTIVHSSFMPSWHYIKTVTIDKNKQPLTSYPYQSQPGDEFTYTYEVSVMPGDILVVNAFCSMYGSRTEMIKIPEIKTP